jgi:hypothetical protein
MGLRPTQGDEKRLLFSNYSPWKRHLSPCHPDRSAAQWRDLRFSGPSVEMFFDGAQRSGENCGFSLHSKLSRPRPFVSDHVIFVRNE